MEPLGSCVIFCSAPLRASARRPILSTMNALSVRGLTKTYKNGIQALKGVDLDVEQGDFFALLGPNGAGKTTLIGIVTSLVNKTAGQATVFGHDIDRELEAAKACIGIVPQEFNFNQFETPYTIVVNQAGFYGIPRPVARERAEKYLKQLQLWDRKDKMARALSGGMKRRLMIARALVHEPRLLILDEPTAGVDIEIRRSMWEFLRGINEQGTTIILTTHYLEEAETLCRNIAIINGGLIVERDRMSNLLRRLNTETFVLNLRNAATAAPKIEGYAIALVDDHTLEVETAKEQNLNEVFAGLSSLGIEVLSMRNKVNRLEEIFMRLVEKRANGDNSSGVASIAGAASARVQAGRSS
jgi:ABC-2 type transport system ATP-binding protein